MDFTLGIRKLIALHTNGLILMNKQNLVLVIRNPILLQVFRPFPFYFREVNSIDRIPTRSSLTMKLSSLKSFVQTGFRKLIKITFFLLQQT